MERITDEAWSVILPFLQQSKEFRVKEPEECRLFVDAVLWITRTGAQWRALPETFGNWNAVYKRFNRWAVYGIWSTLLSLLAKDADTTWCSMDGTGIRAHPCAAGAPAQKGGKKVRH
jgi:transposase